MSRRIWTKPFIKYNLSGDRTVAKSLERRARACVGYLFDQLMPNQKFRSQNWNYPDGSRITAFVWRDVLGERARVEVFATTAPPVRIGVFYMDSGFVGFGESNGSMWQNNGTRLLYLNTSDDSMALFLPKEGVEGGNTPPSFTESAEYAGKVGAYNEAPPGDYTGKLRWLASGQFGLKPDSDEWRDRWAGFMRDDAPIGRVSGEGIYTTESGDYWYIRLDVVLGVPEGDATKLSIPVGINGGSSAFVEKNDIRRQVETHVLAVARPTEITKPLVFSGADFYDYAEHGLPLAYGWHFDRNGRRAVIVTHKTTSVYDGVTGATTLTVTSRKFEASISEETVDGEPVFLFSVVNTETYEWQAPPRLVLWKTDKHPTLGFRHVPLYGTDSSEYYDDRDAPISCFFDDNDELTDYRFTYTTEDVPDDFGPCHPHILNGVTRTIGWNHPGGKRRIFAITCGGNRVDTFDGPVVNGTWDTSLDISFASITATRTLDCSRPYSRTLGTYTGDCPDSPQVEVYSVNIPHWEMSYCQVEETYSWVDVAYYRAEWTIFTNSGDSGGAAIVPPYGEADGIIFASERTTGAARRHEVRVGLNESPSEFNPSGYNWKAQHSYIISQCPNITTRKCKSINGDSSPQVINLAGWPGETTSDPSVEDYNVVSEFNFFSRGRVHTSSASEQTDFILNQGLWGRWFWRSNLNIAPETTTSVMKLVSSMGGDVFAFDGREFSRSEDFPSAAQAVVGWA